MDSIVYWLVHAVVRGVQCLPITWVGRIGRFFGGVVWFVDGRHRRIAIDNLNQALGREYSPAQIHDLARENFRRLGENYLSAVKTASMPPEALKRHVEVRGARELMALDGAGTLTSRVVAIGHFGNFELFARFSDWFPGYKCATTYRGLQQASLNRVMQDLRARSGCVYFERRRDAGALKAAMAQPGLLLGLLADQHAGDGGIRLPFFGRDCSTSAAPALFALRYRCPLHVGFCYRLELGRWCIEYGDEIPTHVGGRPRDCADIMRDVNLAYEKAIRRDPANWFWVHRRWKPAPPPRGGTPAPAAPLVPVGEGG